MVSALKARLYRRAYQHVPQHTGVPSPMFRQKVQPAFMLHAGGKAIAATLNHGQNLAELTVAPVSAATTDSFLKITIFF